MMMNSKAGVWAGDGVALRKKLTYSPAIKPWATADKMFRFRFGYGRRSGGQETSKVGLETRLLRRASR
jgi:hypothetical protein